MASTILAYDYSGSTGGNEFYHKTTQEIVSGLRKSQTQVLLWDDRPRPSTFDNLASINARRAGSGGTSPHVIAEYCSSNKIAGTLVIVSDGQVSSYSVDAADNICNNTNWHPTHVVCHLIHTGSEPNMSISCPFTRTCPHEIYLYRSGHQRETVSSVSQTDIEAFALLDTVKTVADFEKVYTSLEKVIVARTMGKTGDGGLRDKILALRKRLIATAAEASGTRGPAVELAESLAAGDWPAALTAANHMASEYYGTDKTCDSSTWNGKVSRLVAMCEGALRTSFGAGAAAKISTQLQRATTVTTIATATVPLSDAQVEAAADFVCPVSFEEDKDVVVLVRSNCTPFFEGQDKSVVDDVLNCPLNVLRYPVLVERMVERLDSVVGLSTMRAERYTHSPTTGEPVLGGFVLGACREHADATNSTLARSLTGGKLAGNPDLWFAVVWLISRNVPAVASAVPHIESHMLWRLRYSTTFASLSGLPEFVTTKIPVGAAAWYVFAASSMHHATGALFGEVPAACEPLRAHLMHIDALRELVSLAGYELPVGTEQHVVRLRVLLHMLSWVKRTPGKLGAAMMALTQAAYRPQPDNVRAAVTDVESWSDWIPLDGPAGAAQITAAYETLPPMYRGLSVSELVGLASMVDASKSASDISLSIDWVAPVARQPYTEWKYGLGVQPPTRTHISLQTCRPMRFAEDGTTWETAAFTYYGLAPQYMMSTVAKYALFVQKFGTYPTADELIVYLYNRYVVHGTKKTLPACTLQFVQEVLDMYNEARTLEPVEFVRRFDSSRNREERAVLDGSCVA